MQRFDKLCWMKNCNPESEDVLAYEEYAEGATFDLHWPKSAKSNAHKPAIRDQIVIVQRGAISKIAEVLGDVRDIGGAFRYVRKARVLWSSARGVAFANLMGFDRTFRNGQAILIENSKGFDRRWRSLRAFQRFVARITSSLRAQDYQPTDDPDLLDKRVQNIRLRGRVPRPAGNVKAKSFPMSGLTIVRLPQVKAWVLQEADGKCDVCRERGPFRRSDGSWYLEVHHVEGLAKSRKDVVENAAALCPNCHKFLEYGVEAERDKAKKALKIRVARRCAKS